MAIAITGAYCAAVDDLRWLVSGAQHRGFFSLNGSTGCEMSNSDTRPQNMASSSRPACSEKHSTSQHRTAHHAVRDLIHTQVLTASQLATILFFQAQQTSSSRTPPTRCFLKVRDRLRREVWPRLAPGDKGGLQWGADYRRLPQIGDMQPFQPRGLDCGAIGQSHGRA